jgi:N-acetylglutamate synthase-like GNAT family acetyltransferase
MLIEMIAIHPAYWHRGYGKALIKWGLAIAESDGVRTGVVANAKAVGLYLSLGFVQVGTFKVPDEEEPPNNVEGVLLIHDV